MGSLVDVARFRADDPEELVMASLACNLCLAVEPVDWELAGDGWEAVVECHCRDCHDDWLVYLSPWQAFRLGLIATAH